MPGNQETKRTAKKMITLENENIGKEENKRLEKRKEPTCLSVDKGIPNKGRENLDRGTKQEYSGNG